ncbi:hypothetical protein F5884DRAFT_836389 [Xylogone sp. PMI_703]|nr:hypothetical protein F5884DRAFT_836389 [Xylogone sp. PMI_703]
MKGFSFLAITGLFASSFAAPALPVDVSHSLNVIPNVGSVVGTAESAAAPVTGVVGTAESAAAPVTGLAGSVPAVGSVAGTAVGATGAVSEVAPLKRAADASQVVYHLQTLHTTIISHTTIIKPDSTVVKYTNLSSSSQSSQTTVVGNLVINEITAISIAVNNVVSAISPLKGTITATTAEVTQIAGLLFSIIAELVFTVLNVLRVLGIKTLLSGLLISVTGVIATLLHIVETVVGGVLVVLGGIINVTGIVGAVDGVLVGLVGGILSGNIVSLVPVAL